MEAYQRKTGASGTVTAASCMRVIWGAGKEKSHTKMDASFGKQDEKGFSY